MTYTVAVTGKGGTGKSTVSAILVRLLLDRGIGPILAVDADPNSSLGPLIGLPDGPAISDIREEMLRDKAKISGISKERILATKIEECIRESEGVDLLTMGRPEGPTCYCYINNLLRGALRKMKSSYRVTIIDNEAGMEHLSRMNTEAIDCMVLVNEPTVVSARASSRIAALTEELPVTVRRRVLVWNKTRASGVPAEALEVLDGCEFHETVALPDDDNVHRLSAVEQSVMEAVVPESFTPLVESCTAGM